MTTVRFFQNNGIVQAFECEGHSGYDESGSDIVCAAISSAMQQTHIFLEDVLDIYIITEMCEQTARIYIELPKVLAPELQKSAQDAIKAFKINMLNIAQEYQDYIKVMEVQHNA